MRYLLTVFGASLTLIASSNSLALSSEIDLNTLCSKFPHNSKCEGYEPSNEDLQGEKENTSEILPISVKPGSIEAISVAQIRTGITPGTEIGKLRTGLLGVVRDSFYTAGLISAESQNAYHQIINRELEQHGYTINGTENSVSSVFSNVSLSNDRPTRFFIGGTIEDTTLNANSSVAGNHTKADIKVKWEVLDHLHNKVVFTKTTSGKTKVSGITMGATLEAFKVSFRELLATKEFSDNLLRLTQEPVVTTTNISAGKTIKLLPASSKELNVKEITSQSVSSVVGIESSKGKGTGFFIGREGLILTNAHVVKSDYRVNVKLYDQSIVAAEVIQKDTLSDLALLRVSGNFRPPIGLPLCHSDIVSVGEETVAIGNPIGLEYSVTKGIISAIREDNNRRLLQIDAAVNPGNSGGPLINEFGSVVGIVSSKISLQGIEGLGFAIPVGEAINRLNIKVDFREVDPTKTCGVTASN